MTFASYSIKMEIKSLYQSTMFENVASVHNLILQNNKLQRFISEGITWVIAQKRKFYEHLDKNDCMQNL